MPTRHLLSFFLCTVAALYPHGVDHQLFVGDQPAQVESQGGHVANQLLRILLEGHEDAGSELL